MYPAPPAREDVPTSRSYLPRGGGGGNLMRPRNRLSLDVTWVFIKLIGAFTIYNSP